MKNKKIFITISIIVISVIICFLLFILSVLGLSSFIEQVNLINEVNEISENYNETIEEPTYITRYTWDNNDCQHFYNTYYVDRGYEDKPITQYYIAKRVETEKGDLEAGKYKVTANRTEKVSYFIYVTDEPIEDLNTYDGKWESMMGEPIEIELKKGQYVYLVAGYNNFSLLTLEKE